MIKFRAWDKRENTMRDVAVLHFTKRSKVNSIEYWKTPSELKSYHVRNLVLMQSTGLKDKNGVEIFVGDIVRHSEVATDISIVRFGEFGVPNIEEQSYQDCAVGFYYENASEFKDIEPFNMTVPLNSDYVKGVLVIGNIYEQPELLSSGIE